MKGKILEILPISGGEWRITIATRENPGRLYQRLKDKFLEITLKEADRKRSLDANAFCWALCSDIGKAITPPVEKEEIYRKAIRAVGVYTPADVVIWNVEPLIKRWCSQGVGWFVDVVDNAGCGKKRVHIYYGSSTYTVEEMRLLIDWLVDQAEQMEIPIPLSKKRQEALLTQWGRKKEREKDDASRQDSEISG